MAKYSTVQFVAWELYTGPVHDIKGRAIDYAGLKSSSFSDPRLYVFDQCVDISARIEFTKLAIEQAYVNSVDYKETLKIFMAPEFLYRGAGGAYMHDLINGWKISPFPTLPEPYNTEWKGLFGELRDFVADDRFEDWIFVFGTAISASFETQTFNNIKIIDSTSPATCINASLIQCGGKEHKDDCYVTQKHLLSSIDFIDLKISADTVHSNPNVKPFTPALFKLLDNMTVEEGGAVFAFNHICHLDENPIKFGIEVCLDHARGGLKNQYGRLRESGQRVDIQLVPSGGMSLQEASVFLLPARGDRSQSYAFGCDGLSSLSHRYSSHVQLWSQLLNDTCTHLLDIDDSFAPNDPNHFPLADMVTIPVYSSLAHRFKLVTIQASKLWTSIEPYDPATPNIDQIQLSNYPKGAGFVRPLPVMPLNPIGSVCK